MPGNARQEFRQVDEETPSQNEPRNSKEQWKISITLALFEEILLNTSLCPKYETFFTFRDKINRVNLSVRVRQIVHLAYLWIFTTYTLDQLIKKTKLEPRTISDWLGLLREVFQNFLEGNQNIFA